MLKELCFSVKQDIVARVRCYVVINNLPPLPNGDGNQEASRALKDARIVVDVDEVRKLTLQKSQSNDEHPIWSITV